MKQGRRTSRDPYFYWKIVNMILACAVLILAVLLFLGVQSDWTVPAVYILGIFMCTLSGIMELAKGKRVIGYFCSVFAGILAVALLVCIIKLW